MTALTQRAKSPLWWPLAALCVLFGLLQLWLFSILLLGNPSNADWALNNDQRVWFSAAGTQYPAPLQPEMPQAAEVNDSLAPTQEAAASPQPSAAAEQAAAKAEAKQAEADKAAKILEEFAETAQEAAPVMPAPSAPQSFIASNDELRDVIPAQPRTADSLNAPDDALSEPWEGATLPMRDGDRTPFEYYRRPYEAAAGNPPKIAIIVVGLGAIRAQTDAASELPKNVSLAFSAYAPQSKRWMSSVRNAGQEAWLMLPAQPDSFPAGDGGPNALLAEQAPEESLMRLKRIMSQNAGYAGLVLPVGEAFSDHLPRLQWLQGQLSSRGLALIAAERPNNSAAQGWFRKAQLAHTGHVVIDHTLSASAIQDALKALELQARQHGQALGVVRAYPLSLRALKPWLAQLPAKGLALAPASALVVQD